MKKLTRVDLLVLTAIKKLDPNGYGVSVSEDIEARTGQRPAMGSIYASFDRLIELGLAKSRTGEATPERGGRRKTHYAITGAGRKELAVIREYLTKMLA